jgi:hypothetical protein
MDCLSWLSDDTPPTITANDGVEFIVTPLYQGGPARSDPRWTRPLKGQFTRNSEGPRQIEDWIPNALTVTLTLQVGWAEAHFSVATKSKPGSHFPSKCHFGRHSRFADDIGDMAGQSNSPLQN